MDDRITDKIKYRIQEEIEGKEEKFFLNAQDAASKVDNYAEALQDIHGYLRGNTSKRVKKSSYALVTFNIQMSRLIAENINNWYHREAGVSFGRQDGVHRALAELIVDYDKNLEKIENFGNEDVLFKAYGKLLEDNKFLDDINVSKLSLQEKEDLVGLQKFLRGSPFRRQTNDSSNEGEELIKRMLDDNTRRHFLDYGVVTSDLNAIDLRSKIQISNKMKKVHEKQLAKKLDKKSKKTVARISEIKSERLKHAHKLLQENQQRNEHLTQELDQTNKERDSLQKKVDAPLKTLVETSRKKLFSKKR